MNAIDDALFQELIFWKLFLNFLCIFSRLFWNTLWDDSDLSLDFFWTFSGLFLDSFWTFSGIFLNFSGFHVNSVDLSYWWIYFGPMYSGSNTRRGLRQVFTPRWIHFGSNAARFARALRPSAFGLRLVAGGLRAYTAPVPLDLVYPCTRREVSTEGSMALEDL